MIQRRREFLFGATAFLATTKLAAASLSAIRVASNQGTENAALQRLMADRGYAQQFDLDMRVIEAKDIAGPIGLLETDRADVCMISAYAGVLPAIEQGQAIRLIGTAMRLPALAVCAKDPTIQAVRDLIGRRVGIGERNGLLHLIMQALLRRYNVPLNAVSFVPVGSNAQVFRAVLGGDVDAGACGVAGLSEPHVHVLRDGELWRALPHFTYQLAYASERALRDRRDAVARCLAAYARLYNFVSQPSSRAAYLAARIATGGDAAEGEAVWNFIQSAQPYPHQPGLAASDVDYLQRVNVAAGLQRRVLPFDDVADLAAAHLARRLLVR